VPNRWGYRLNEATRPNVDIGAGKERAIGPEPTTIQAGWSPRNRFHDQRHTHATWLLAADQPIGTVSERLGHAKVSITIDTYGHVVSHTRR
jgi:integrase